MKRKVLAIICIAIIVWRVNFSYADDDMDDEDEVPRDIVETAASTDEELFINSRIAVAYDRASGRAIWGKDENKKTAMASTTKIVTALVTIENANLDDVVIISRKAAGTGGSRLGLNYEDKVSVKDLLYGLMLKSGNDCAVALAEHVGGSTINFAELMNQKAKGLDLRNTHFVTPHGLDDPEHYTTAFELAKIADCALHNDIFSKIVATQSYTICINGRSKNINNTNELLGYFPGVYGVKTGFTNNAGRCLVTAVKNEKLDIITVALQADTKKDRTRDSIKIINHIFNLYERINVNEMVCEVYDEWLNINSNRISINRAKNSNVKIGRGTVKNEKIVVKKSKYKDVKVVINVIYEFEAPIQPYTKIGELKIFVDGDILEIVDIYIENEIQRKDYIDYLNECFQALTHIL